MYVLFTAVPMIITITTTFKVPFLTSVHIASQLRTTLAIHIRQVYDAYMFILSCCFRSKVVFSVESVEKDGRLVERALTVCLSGLSACFCLHVSVCRSAA